MGNNSVAFILNDLMHTLEKSPHAVAYALTHPPMNGDEEQRRWKQSIVDTAQKHGEPIPHFQALQMMATYHASDTHTYLAGGNGLTRCEIEEYIEYDDGSRYAMIKLPEWFTRDCYTGRQVTWKKRRRHVKRLK